MCGRFTQHYTWAEVHAFLDVFGAARNLRPRYNIAPTTAVDVMRLDADGRRELVTMRWGLVPVWWKKATPLPVLARRIVVAKGLDGDDKVLLRAISYRLARVLLSRVRRGTIAMAGEI